MEKERRTEDGYWQERDSQFVLHIDGTERAIVNRSANTGVILSMPGEPGYKFTAPDSQTVFDAVEQRLGIGRIEEFRTAQGMRTIIPWRDMAENHAGWSRSKHPPGKEAEHYTQQAWNLLNHKSIAGGLTNEANDARFILGKVLVSLERDQLPAPHRPPHPEAARTDRPANPRRTHQRAKACHPDCAAVPS